MHLEDKERLKGTSVALQDPHQNALTVGLCCLKSLAVFPASARDAPTSAQTRQKEMTFISHLWCPSLPLNVLGSIESLRVTLDNAVQLDLNCYLYLIMVLMPVGYFNIHFPEKSRVGCPPTFLMDVSCLDFLLFLLGLIFQIMHSCPVSWYRLMPMNTPFIFHLPLSNFHNVGSKLILPAVWIHE